MAVSTDRPKSAKATVVAAGSRHHGTCLGGVPIAILSTCPIYLSSLSIVGLVRLLDARRWTKIGRAGGGQATRPRAMTNGRQRSRARRPRHPKGPTTVRDQRLPS